MFIDLYSQYIGGKECHFLLIIYHLHIIFRNDFTPTNIFINTRFIYIFNEIKLFNYLIKLKLFQV